MAAQVDTDMRENVYDVVLLPGQGQALEWRRRAADAAGGVRAGKNDNGDSAVPLAGGVLFGTTVATFDSWLADLWELFGDGRTIISPVERSAAMAAAFRGVDASEGTVHLAVRLARDASGLREFDAAVERCASGALGSANARGVLGGASGALGTPDAPDGAPDASGDASGALRDAPDAVGSDCELAAAERELLAQMGKYFKVIDKVGLVELGHVAATLPEMLPESFRASVLMENAAPLSERERRFFAACPGLRLAVSSASGADGVALPSEGVDVRFAFPSGRYARPLLLADLVRGLVAEAADAEPREAGASSGGNPCVVIACADPKDTFESIAPVLSRTGVSCALRASVPFSHTDFGRALSALNRLSGEGGGAAACGSADLSDVLHMPFSGVSVLQARRIDAGLRGDRLADVSDACATVRATDQAFSYLEEMAQDPEAGILAGAVEDAMRRTRGVSEGYRHEQTGAVGKAREAMRAASLFGLDMAACLRSLADASVDASCFLSAAGGDAAGGGEADGQGASREPVASGETAGCATTPFASAAPARAYSLAPDVLICSWAHAATLAPGSCYALVADGAESAHHPVASKEDAGTLLLQKLGLILDDDALASARREFSALEAASRRHLVVERCLYDADAEPTYPAMVVEELVDCYRDDPSRTDDIDNPYALPPRFLRNMVERGEERLYENAAVAHGTQPIAAHIERPAMGSVNDVHRPLVVLSRAHGNAAPRLSASQFESYLACPYLWFVQRRLRAESLDEDFGPLQMGDFAHHALCEFYPRFQAETGAPKVTPGFLPQAKAIMEDVLAAEEALQFELGPESNRLVPRTEFERREVSALCRRLVDFLDFEARFLPGFHPAYFEYEVGAKEKVDYAGVRLVGKIDRIDVDERGRAVIVDYKGSVSAAYEPFDGTGAPPKKVQTLIYAQVVKRVLGLNVVGALYLGYGRMPKVAGAFDPVALEAAHLPAMRHDRCRCEVEGPQSFAGLLDETEARCAHAAELLLAGDVAPNPAGAHACAYCPHSACVYRED